MATDNKYDRQLRLWGAHGQKALMEAHICLLNASGVGTESLKNLVLPGCGKVTIVDSATVSVNDCSNNFFVTRDEIGKPRAEVTLAHLLELNPDVTGAHRIADPVKLIAEEPSFFESFDVILATQLPEAAALALSSICTAAHISLVIARSYGLIGAVRLVANEHTVVESKSDFDEPDLRLSAPFKEMQEFAASFDLKALSDVEYGHVPYPVLLIHFLQAWKAEHGGSAPSSFAEKKEFREFVQTQARRPWGDEDNLVEAYEFAYFAYKPATVSVEVKEVLEDDKTKQLTASSQPFWFVARAVAEFVAAEGAGALPLAGDLPDLTATTAWYMALQKVYKTKAVEHLAIVRSKLDALLTTAGLAKEHVSDDYLQTFVKNARNLRVYRMRGLEEEVKDVEPTKEELQGSVWMGEQTPSLWYLMLRAADQFHAKAGRYAGVDAATAEEDSKEMAGIAAALCKTYDLEDKTLSEKHVAEIVRYGGGELHNISAIVGGIASQEAVKLLTHQYEPMNNLYVFNGITGNGARYQV